MPNETTLSTTEAEFMALNKGLKSDIVEQIQKRGVGKVNR